MRHTHIPRPFQFEVSPQEHDGKSGVEVSVCELLRDNTLATPVQTWSGTSADFTALAQQLQFPEVAVTGMLEELTQGRTCMVEHITLDDLLVEAGFQQVPQQLNTFVRKRSDR